MYRFVPRVLIYGTLNYPRRGGSQVLLSSCPARSVYRLFSSSSTSSSLLLFLVPTRRREQSDLAYTKPIVNHKLPGLTTRIFEKRPSPMMNLRVLLSPLLRRLPVSPPSSGVSFRGASGSREIGGRGETAESLPRANQCNDRVEESAWFDFRCVSLSKRFSEVTNTGDS